MGGVGVGEGKKNQALVTQSFGSSPQNSKIEGSIPGGAQPMNA